MSKRILIIAALLMLVVPLFVFAQPKPRVAVMDFSEEYSENWWVRGRLGTKASTLLTEGLVQTRKFSVIERREIATILKEHNLSASGGVTPETAVQLGKLLGADYMVLGAVTEFGWDKYGGSIRRLGGIGGTLYNYNSRLSIRIINVETTEIIFAGTGAGSHRTGAVGIDGNTAGSESSYDSVAGETLQPAINQLVEQVVAESASMNTYQGFGRVADVDNGEVLINRGSAAGVTVGQQFSVVRLGKEIKDPDTGQVLKRKESAVGVIEVISVDGANMSTCRIVSGEVKAGDMIK